MRLWNDLTEDSPLGVFGQRIRDEFDRVLGVNVDLTDIPGDNPDAIIVRFTDRHALETALREAK